MVSGEAGSPLVHVLGAVEEATNISLGAVTLLFLPMVGNIAAGTIFKTNPAMPRNAEFQVDHYN